MNDFRRSKQTFDVVDLDPYGTAIPFLEGAITSLSNNGMLCVTCTDMAVLCARSPHVCFYRYGSAPLGKPYCHEQALRMILFTINSMANKHGKRIEPLMSLTVDFYVRLFIRIKVAPQQCHQSITKYSNIHQCTFCESHWLQPMGEAVPVREKKKVSKAERKAMKKSMGAAAAEEEIKEETKQPMAQEGNMAGKVQYRTARVEVPSSCTVCDSKLTIGGPIWNQPIHNVDFVRRLLVSAEKSDCSLKTVGRIKGILGGIIDEEPLQDLPLSYNLHDVCSTIRTQNPEKKKIHAAFASLGHRLCQTYYNGDLWKTDAPPEVVYDILKKYKKQVTPEQYVENVAAGSPARNILAKPIVHDCDFAFVKPVDEN